MSFPLSTIIPGKAISIQKRLKRNYFLAVYEDVVELPEGPTNWMIVERFIFKNQEHFFKVDFIFDPHNIPNEFK